MVGRWTILHVTEYSMYVDTKPWSLRHSSGRDLFGSGSLASRRGKAWKAWKARAEMA